MSDDNKTHDADISDKIKNWREQREKRLLDRIYRRNRFSSYPGIQPISAAVLGIKKSTSANEPRSNKASGRLSVNPKYSRKSTINKNVQPARKSDSFKPRFCPGNPNQRRTVMNHSIFNQRRSTMKINNVDNLVSNKVFKKNFSKNILKQSEIDVKEIIVNEKGGEVNISKADSVENLEFRMMPPTFDENSDKMEGKISESDGSDKHNSTFTLTNEDENLPSPIKNTNIGDDKPKQNHKLQSILRPSKKSSQPYDMRNKLQEWATSRGKSVNSYRHLNCFVSKVAPKSTVKPPLPVARKVQFSLSGGKCIFTPKRSVNQERRKTVSFKNVTEKLSAVTEAVTENGENSLVELDSVADCGPTASTPEEEPEQPISLQLPEVQPPFTSEVLKSMTVSALEELLSIIQANYNTEACEEWLLAIRQRNIDADELPQYWECMAAIEEARGNMYLALDSYQRAVVQGAEIKHIESCLDRMYDKLKALNINSKEDKENGNSDQPNIVYNSAKNKDVFRSTVISFARIQKKAKQLNWEEGDKKTIKYLVTPVRRSTRYSASRIDTPFLTLSNTVKEFLPDDDNERTGKEEIQFKTNKALLNYF